MDTQTITVDFFQTDGAAATLEAASQEYEQKNPGTKVLTAKFQWASPQTDAGRWVGISLSYLVVG